MKALLTIAICLWAASALGAQELAGVSDGASSAVASEGFRQEGIASWYGAEFEGRPTASGEIFNTRLLTAAHPSLPFGTMLTVTNRHNGKKVVVRVNDRGPFVASRILDVSRAAAEQLDMIVTGTAPVTIEAVGRTGAPSARPAPTAPAPAASVPSSAKPAVPSAVPAAALSATIRPALPDPANGKKYRIQVGSYRDSKHAAEAFNRLGAAGLAPAYERYGDYYRVVLAGVGSDEVRSMADRLGAAGFMEVLIREER